MILSSSIQDTLYINLSDIHIKTDVNEMILTKLEEFNGYIETLRQKGGFENVVVMISGDIAFSGIKEEYDLLKPILTKIAESAKILLCPGNHDHDFSNSSKTRLTMLKTPLEDIEDDLIEFVTKGQAEYFAFESVVSSLQPTKKSNLSNLYEVSDKINIQSLNTAWCSSLKEKGGTLKLPINKILTPKDEKINILFFHHPLSWFEPNNQKEIRNYITDSFDIIITGHEHIADSFKVTTENTTSLMIESISFDDPTIAENGFLSFMMKDNDVVIEKHIWDNNRFLAIQSMSKSEIISASSKCLNGVELNLDFYNTLKDIGAGFIHSNQDELNLNDLFVYPNINIQSENNDRLKSKSAKLLLTDNSLKKTIITGEECSGKSTLLKKLYLEHLANDSLPVLLDGSNIIKAKKLDLKLIEFELSNQYENFTYQNFIENKKEKVLIIDNFDSIKGNSKELGMNMSKVMAIFDKVLITVSDSYDLGDSRIISDNIFVNFEKVEILRLGFRLRLELINKWNLLKDECQNSKDELVIRNDVATRTINGIIGKNYIPSSPLFLLTMLQSIDTGTASDMNTSSYGYYYQYLITTSLGNSGIKKEQLDEMFNYIKELSYHFYVKKIKEDSSTNLWDFNATFCKVYGLKIDAGNRLKKLVKAKILACCSKEQTYTFKYPYIYYFFIAKYLAESLFEESTQEIIENLIESLNVNKNMNILMFLTHHSKDKLILKKIISRSKQLFENEKMANLDMDSMFIDNIVNSLPAIVYEADNSNTLENRLEVEEEKDQSHPEHVKIDPELEDDDKDDQPENSKAVDLIKELNLSFKSLELLGQLSRNYYGSLKADQKSELIEEAISAPLRGIGAVFSVLNKNPDETLELIKTAITNKIGNTQDIDDKKVDQFAREALFNLMGNISYGFIKKIASSIGNVNLMPVIEDLTNKVDTNSHKLIYLATKLDMGNYVTPDSVKQLIHTIEQNALSSTLTKALILNYLYMFEVKDEVVQKLCKVADINYKPISTKLLLDKQRK
jgi:predicted MPP superfamily phosphohydrolase